MYDRKPQNSVKQVSFNLNVKQTKKRMFKAWKKVKTENYLRDLWDDIKHTNICIIEVSEEKKEGDQKYIWGN